MMKAPSRFRSRLFVWGLLLAAQPSTALQSSTAPDGQHDFDFEIGTWKTHLRRLQHPLTGSTTWIEYEGTTVVRKVWNGRANLVELAADGPGGHFEGLSLRLYNPESRQWSLNFSNSSGGTLSPPTIGAFKDGRGEFFSQDTFKGRAILVRFVISDITPNSCRFEQSFSEDGGKTWEVNWIATDTRVADEPGNAQELRSGGFVDAHPVVVIHGPAAHVRITLVDGGVDGRALLRVSRPASFRARDDAGTNAIAYFCDSNEGATRVSDPDLVSGGDAPRCGIVRMDHEPGDSRPPFL